MDDGKEKTQNEVLLAGSAAGATRRISQNLGKNWDELK